MHCPFCRHNDSRVIDSRTADDGTAIRRRRQCPECGHEWVSAESGAEGGDAAGERVVKDSVGNVLQDGDSVVVVKALKVKGSPSGIKAGTKVRNIRLVDGVDGHDIDCKVDGFGAMQLKSSVVKKA